MNFSPLASHHQHVFFCVIAAAFWSRTWDLVLFFSFFVLSLISWKIFPRKTTNDAIHFAGMKREEESYRNKGVSGRLPRCSTGSAWWLCRKRRELNPSLPPFLPVSPLSSLMWRFPERRSQRQVLFSSPSEFVQQEPSSVSSLKVGPSLRANRSPELELQILFGAGNKIHQLSWRWDIFVAYSFLFSGLWRNF